MKISCAIIDDEPLARKGLTEYVHDVDFLQLEGVYEDALKAGPAMTLNKIELIFLDIQMPRITGIDFLKTLTHPPLVILTTAYPQFALEGYELNVLDYLVKPISFPRFLKAVVKAKEQLELKHHEQPSHDLKDDYIFIKADNKLVKIFFKNIFYVEALQNYVCVHTADKKYITYLTFKSIEENLPHDLFLKVHKSYIIQLAKVDAVDGNELHLGQFRVPISRNNKEEVMQKLIANKFLKR